MLWRGYEIARACAEVGPKALIGVSCFGDETPIKRFAAVAVARSSIRFVLGSGPHLPGGDLDEAMNGNREPAAIGASAMTGPALVTFTARAGAPFVAVERSEEELLAQGAMTVLALDLDGGDVILNPYPLTGPAGLALGLMPWLVAAPRSLSISPSPTARRFRRAGHRHGRDRDRAPGPVLAQLATDGVPQAPQCRLRRAGAVWTRLEQGDPLPVPFGGEAAFFDLYPLGDLAGLVLWRERPDEPRPFPWARSKSKMARKTPSSSRRSLRRNATPMDTARSSCAGRSFPTSRTLRPLAPDGDGFIGTGLLGKVDGAAGTSFSSREIPNFSVTAGFRSRLPSSTKLQASCLPRRRVFRGRSGNRRPRHRRRGAAPDEPVTVERSTGFSSGGSRPINSPTRSSS